MNVSGDGENVNLLVAICCFNSFFTGYIYNQISYSRFIGTVTFKQYKYVNDIYIYIYIYI